MLCFKYENVDYTHGKALILISPSPRDLNYIQESKKSKIVLNSMRLQFTNYSITSWRSGRSTRFGFQISCQISTISWKIIIRSYWKAQKEVKEEKEQEEEEWITKRLHICWYTFKVIKQFSKSMKSIWDLKNNYYIRRTDHLAMDNVEGLAPLKPSYYLEAMDIFRFDRFVSHTISIQFDNFFIDLLGMLIRMSSLCMSATILIGESRA